MPSTQIHFNVAVGYKARNDIKTKTGVTLKITDKVGTQKGTIFVADLVGTRDQIANATKMIRDSEERAFEWARKNKEARAAFRRHNEMDYNPEPVLKKPSQKKPKASGNVNPFLLLQNEEPSNEEPPVAIEKPHTKDSKKNAARHAKHRYAKEAGPSFSMVVAKSIEEPVQKRKVSTSIESSQVKKIKLEPVNTTKKILPVSWADAAWDSDGE